MWQQVRNTSPTTRAREPRSSTTGGRTRFPRRGRAHCDLNRFVNGALYSWPPFVGPVGQGALPPRVLCSRIEGHQFRCRIAVPRRRFPRTAAEREEGILEMKRRRNRTLFVSLVAVQTVQSQQKKKTEKDASNRRGRLVSVDVPANTLKVTPVGCNGKTLQDRGNQRC